MAKGTVKWFNATKGFPDLSSLQLAAKTFSFIFRRSRKLAFPRSTKDRRWNTKRLPIAAKLRPRTSRFKAGRAVSDSALSDPIREWDLQAQLKKTECNGQERELLLRAPTLRPRRRFGPQFSLTRSFNRHDIRRLQIAARPHVDDPFDPGWRDRPAPRCCAASAAPVHCRGNAGCPPRDISTGPTPATPAAGWWCCGWCPSNRSCACRRRWRKSALATRLSVPRQRCHATIEPDHRLLHCGPFRRRLERGPAARICVRARRSAGVKFVNLRGAGIQNRSKRSSMLRGGGKIDTVL